MIEHLAYYSPVQYLKAVALLKQGKKNFEVAEELYISHTAVMEIKKMIKGSLSIEQTRQLQ